MAALSGFALLGVGAVESLCGLYCLLFPATALTSIVGRYLSVGAVQSSPALLPMISQAGALRLALGVLILSYATGPMPGATAHKLEACVVAHTCLLQPFAATFRSHPRMPVGGGLALSLLEGCALVLGMAVDADFETDVLLSSTYFLATLVMLALGLLLAILGSSRAPRLSTLSGFSRTVGAVDSAPRPPRDGDRHGGYSVIAALNGNDVATAIALNRLFGTCFPVQRGDEAGGTMSIDACAPHSAHSLSGARRSAAHAAHARTAAAPSPTLSTASAVLHH